MDALQTRCLRDIMSCCEASFVILIRVSLFVVVFRCSRERYPAGPAGAPGPRPAY